ncbi:Cytochrome P450 [Amycolatopsis arida]|uniref:Cytochrome P450 n=1 Tax=Amycolatopsis arida TaxID=587909 RepID=A0A1I5P2I7_9PSEU|nr:cytochrome P450 [Amycolatopsis arida]TDX98331.1 cytochrome P450 [Amycolatopsis arida]SFP28242.1 Cytochrome P450 [Amycolatopsis arida]
MTIDTDSPMRLPITRRSVLDPPPELAELRQRCPVAPLTYVDGHIGWLVTSYELARAVLQDNRFSSRPELRHSAVHLVLGDGQPPEEDVPGMFVGMDPPEHTRYRKLLTGELNVRRMRQLEPQIAETANMLVDQMRATGTEADLVPAFASPLPSLVICDLLGIPYAEWQTIRPVSERMLRTDSSAEEVKDCFAKIFEFLAEVVQRKKREPEDDLVSGLIALDELSDVEITAIAFQLFTAGHETTANMLALGTYTLLTHPDQLAALRADLDLTEGAVEELLRYLTVIQFGISRAALEDVELAGTTIRAGQTVTVSLPAANRDPARFTDPDVLDIRRPATGNVAFGFGVHQCVAQQLARAEMRIGFRTLFQRLPDLRLAVPAEEVPMRDGAIVYGVTALPVTW